MMLGQSDEKLVETLVEQAQRGVGLLSQAQLEEGWERLQAPVAIARPGVAQRAPVRSWFFGFATASALAGVTLLAYRALPPGPAPALRYSLEGVAQNSGNAITASPAREARLRFSDESQVILDPSTKLAVAATDARGAHIVLVDGVVNVEVKHRTNTSWEFAAGPFRVKVKGTAFRLGFEAGRGYLRLRMSSGLVEVFAPAGRTIAVGAGEALELFAVPPQPQATAVPAVPAATPPRPEPAEGEPAANLAPAPAKNEGTRAPLRRTTMRPSEHGETAAPPAPVTWCELVAHGRFAAVVADAQQRGLGVVIAQATAVELASLADAARYTKRPDLARQVLLAIRARFAGSDHARDASFFLGRLAEATVGQPGAALAWYDTYLGEAPRGLYASEALGREMTLLAHGAPERARTIARTYLERFPRGPQADLARSLLESNPE